MNIVKLICFLGLLGTASIAQQPDSTKSLAITTNQTQVVASSNKTEHKYLSKQASVNKKTTTWTKIKDLFM